MIQEPWIYRLVRYQYIEGLLYGRRVLELGCGSGQSADYLARRAESVVALETSATAVKRAKMSYERGRGNLSFISAEPDRLPQENEAFDMVLVPELQRWITHGQLMPEIRRVLARDGLAMFAVPSSASPAVKGMELSDFSEYLAQSFAYVRFVGEMPFSGRVLADFQPETDELTPELDCSLVQQDEVPHHFVALCSERPLRALGYTVVQVPRVDLGRGTAETTFGAGEITQLNRRIRELELALEQARVEHDKLDFSDSEFSDSHYRTSGSRKAAFAAPDELDVLRQQLVAAEKRAAQIDADARQEIAKLKDKAREAETQLLQQKEKSEAELARLVSELRQKGSEVARIEAELVARKQEAQVAAAAVIVPDPAVTKEHEEAIAQLSEKLKVTQRRADELNQLCDRERMRAESLDKRLEQEHQRYEYERGRGVEVRQEILQLKGKIEVDRLKIETIEGAIKEAKEAVEQQRQRAEGAERRCDVLLGRIEQEAAELSRLHQQLADLQGQRQADLWRIDELTGQVRERELRAGGDPNKAQSTGGAASSARAMMLDNELSQLKTVMQAKEDTIAQLTAQLQAAEQEVQSAQSQVKALEPELAEKREAVERLQKELMKAESRVMENSRRATTAESKIVQMEVRLKRAEAEAQTLSKWAEQLREELKEAQGKTTVRPITPEPEVSALRNDLKVAQERIVTLEQRCEQLVAQAQEQGTAAKSVAVAAPRVEPDPALQQELKTLRERVQKVTQLENALQQATQQLQMAEKKNAEIAAMKKELATLKEQQRQVAATSSNGVDGRSNGGELAPELLQMREHQLEALLSGALLHKQEADQLRITLSEVESFSSELEHERNELQRQLEQCRQAATSAQQQVEHARGSAAELSREVARLSGELRRYKELQVHAAS